MFFICDLFHLLFIPQEGYAKLSEYFKSKLWPEVDLFRERFGYLPEFPPVNNGNCDDEGQQETKVRPENNIKYWQDKLQETEDQLTVLKKNVQKANDSSKKLNDDLIESKRMLETAENDNLEMREALNKYRIQKEELEERLQVLQRELKDKETLVDQGEFIRKSLVCELFHVIAFMSC